MIVLAELTLSEFDADLASESAAPGGGSAAALAGSIGAALVTMVCRLSLERPEVVASDAELRAAIEESERLRLRLLGLVDEDTAAFEAIVAALHLPKDDEMQRAVRAEALAAAKLGAAGPPARTLTAAREGIALAATLAGRVNPNVASDLGVAVHLLLAAAEGALLNVAINLATLPPGNEVSRLERSGVQEIAIAREAATGAAATIAADLGIG